MVYEGDRHVNKLLGCSETSAQPEAQGCSGNTEQEHPTQHGVGVAKEALLEEEAFKRRPNGLTGIRG